MQSLRSDIKALRQQVDGDSKHFFPRQDLIKLLTRQKVRSLLETRKVVPPERLDSLTKQILSGARRVFAILVLLDGKEKEILRFIEYDNLQGLPIDHRLPFPKKELKRLIPEFHDEFYDKQWEFSAPVFLKDTEHRFLNEFSVIPFIKNRKIADGGFGEVFKVELHPGHQDPSWLGPNSTLEFVRKQFKEVVDGSEDSHQQELHGFTLLSHLKHPNIQQLLASFTYQRKHNLIFPLASDGDMEALFRTHPRPTEFKDDLAFYLALTQLCSALEAMHDFTATKSLNIHVMGLHRDIKPSNILVSKGDFILTDFGLSTFKSMMETSATPFRVGGGDYLPPECEDLQTFCKGVVGRSGDVWSLGCVILELLTYMSEGPEGVLRFREERVFQALWRMRTFHGPGKEVNPYVVELMDRLEGSCALPARQLLEVIREMLSIDPSARPKAPEVTAKVQFIALHELLCSMDEPYAEMIRITRSVQGALEFNKLKSWKYVLSFVNRSQNYQQSGGEYSHSSFGKAIALLCESRDEVTRIRERFDVTGQALYHDLRKINEALLDLLPAELLASALAYLDMRLLGDADISAPNIHEVLPGDLFDVDRLGTLAYAKKFSQEISRQYDALSSEAENQESTNLRLNAKDVDIEKHFGEHALGWVPSAQEGNRQKVMIEWVRYDLHWEGDVQKEMIRRVAKIATSLNEMKSRVDTLRMLRCSHYFHSDAKHAFGLVYDLPSQDARAAPQSLYSIIRETRKSGCHQISLEDRFNLARTLASTLLDLHKATLVHKSISSHNIIFNSCNTSFIHEPYLIGFNYARPVQPKAFTTGPPPSRSAEQYYHPKYDSLNVRDAQPFRMVFDYYSLGLVLLEIGIWDTVADIKVKSRQDLKDVKAKSRQDLKEKLLETQVPLLKHCMGTAYHDAVEVCLQDRITEDSPGATMDTVLDFQRLVVGALDSFSLPGKAGVQIAG